MRKIILAAIALSFSVASAAATLADCPHCNNTGCCWKNVVKYRCVEVPDVKPIKKIFYECKLVPYCQKELPCFLHDDCDCCAECDHPRFKRVLVKREVEVGKTCGTKCIVEEYCERVQVPCCHCDCSDPACEAPEKAAQIQEPTPLYQY